MEKSCDYCVDHPCSEQHRCRNGKKENAGDFSKPDLFTPKLLFVVEQLDEILEEIEAIKRKLKAEEN
jgi:hypothetical protein